MMFCLLYLFLKRRLMFYKIDILNIFKKYLIISIYRRATLFKLSLFFYIDKYFQRFKIKVWPVATGVVDGWGYGSFKIRRGHPFSSSIFIFLRAIMLVLFLLLFNRKNNRIVTYVKSCFIQKIPTAEL